ncbi:MAG: c-type cytochrome [Methylohalobius sp. ZOD2]|nr:cytochrome c5 family protein [Methylothermaceae bacterium]
MAWICIVSLPAPGTAWGTKNEPEASAGTTGFWEELHREPEPHRGPKRNGKEVYEYRCQGCHAKATQGAPMPGDAYEWRRRTRQGMAVLMDHVKTGFKQGLMPSRGGCGNCSDAELRAAVDYMLTKSGVQPEAVSP